MVTLNEAKNYLRVDYEEDDALIRQLLQTAKNLVSENQKLYKSLSIIYQKFVIIIC